MKDAEDEAFDELARRQGMWGGGFPAKTAVAAEKLHWSDCAVHNGPAYPAGECDCGATQKWNEDEWRRNNWRCGHGWLRGEQCEICNAPQPAQEPVSFPCCGYTDANAVKWNQFNGVVQCHMCGQVYTVAQPAQEPFGWYSAQVDEFMTHKIRKEHERLNSYTHINGKFDLALYTAAAQPAQEPVIPLYLEWELGYPEHVASGTQRQMDRLKKWLDKYFALIQAQPAQEPVARVSGTYGGRFTYDPINPAAILPVGMAFYAAPQHTATWAGLTDEDSAVVREEESCSFIAGAKWAEKILKGKNT